MPGRTCPTGWSSSRSPNTMLQGEYALGYRQDKQVRCTLPALQSRAGACACLAPPPLSRFTGKMSDPLLGPESCLNPSRVVHRACTIETKRVFGRKLRTREIACNFRAKILLSRDSQRINGTLKCSVYAEIRRLFDWMARLNRIVSTSVLQLGRNYSSVGCFMPCGVMGTMRVVQ